MDAGGDVWGLTCVNRAPLLRGEGGVGRWGGFVNDEDGWMGAKQNPLNKHAENITASRIRWADKQDEYGSG